MASYSNGYFTLVINKQLKKYVLTALTMSVYLVLEGKFAVKKKWWWFPYNIKHNVLAELSLISGPFFTGSIWILKSHMEIYKHIRFR
ncbi:hypothetical protein HRF63_19985 [Bacillus circulans]|nr:hypothetical protein [Niallia circulans]